MGTNLFVEGTPSPVVLSVKLPREVHSFREIADVSAGLADLDRILRNDWPRIWPSFGHRRLRDVWVLSFRVDSPPIFQVLTDPAWLTVFLVVITGYKQGKESLAEMTTDAKKLTSEIKGLTERELELLEIAIRLSFANLLKAPEELALKIANRLRRTRDRLIGDAQTRPEVIVKDIENKYISW